MYTGRFGEETLTSPKTLGKSSPTYCPYLEDLSFRCVSFVGCLSRIRLRLFRPTMRTFPNSHRAQVFSYCARSAHSRVSIVTFGHYFSFDILTRRIFPTYPLFRMARVIFRIFTLRGAAVSNPFPSPIFSAFAGYPPPKSAEISALDK